VAGTEPVSLLGVEAETEKAEIDPNSFLTPNEVPSDLATDGEVGADSRGLEVLSIETVTIENPVSKLDRNFQKQILVDR
jgi:hypothetical protein